MSISQRVSVIIPAYNHEKYVQEAIQSVIDQYYENIELIVVNDGSKDTTWSKINEMRAACEQRFARVVFESQENQGTCLTLNRLISLSEGEYILLLASDDKIAPDSTKLLYDFLSQHPDYALAVGRNEIMDGESVVCYWDKYRNNVYDKGQARYLSFTDLLNGRVDFSSEQFGDYATLLEGNYIPNGYLVRKNIFDKIGLFTTKAPLEDYWLMLQIAKYAKMKYIDATTFYYRWHSANTVTQQEKMFRIIKQTIDYEIDLVRQSNNDDLNKIVDKFLPNRFKTKSYFRIPYIIELYKRNIAEKRELVLMLCGFEFIVNTKIKSL